MDGYANDGVGVVAVTVGSVEDLAAAKRKSGAMFPVVSDVDGVLMDLFGLRDVGANALTGGDVPRAASLLVAADGTVIWKAAAGNYRVRPDATEARGEARAYLEREPGAATGVDIGRFTGMR